MRTQDTLTRAQDQAAAVDDSRGSGEKRKSNGNKLKKYHQPWDTIPVHCIDLVSGRSAIDDKSSEQIWDYLKQSTAILKPIILARPYHSGCRRDGRLERQHMHREPNLSTPA